MRVLAMLLAAACCAPAREPGEFQMARELNLDALAPEPSRAPHDVLALRYSPDGTWMAAVTSRITSEGARSEMLLVPVAGDASEAQHFRFDEDEILSTAERAGIHWSPDGEFVAVETKRFSAVVLAVRGGARCELPRATVFGGFIGPGLALSADWDHPKDPASIPLDSSVMTVYGTDCKARQSWKLPGRARDVESSPLSELIAYAPDAAEIRILRRASPLEVAHVPERSGGMLRFGEKGTVLCKADYGERGKLACYELKTGERFAHAVIVGGAPFDVSAEGSLVVAAQGGYNYEMNGGKGRRRFTDWVVWDYRSGRELGRLRYRGQRHDYVVSPAAVAPDGRSFAVAVRGAIRVYELSGR